MQLFGRPVAARARRPVTAARRGGSRAGHRLAVCGIAAAFAAGYAAYSIVNHLRFGTTIYDAVIFDQAIRGYAGFGPPVSAALGYHGGPGIPISVLADHFSPVLALLAPLYWLHDGPITLYVAQAVLFALAIPPLWVFTSRALGTAAAYLVAVAYGLSWEVQTAVGFDFHEAAFAPVIMATAFERAQAGRRGQAALAACALLLVKEDMGLAVSGFGIVLLVMGSRRLGAALTAGGVTATWLLTRYVIPAFGGERNARWHYDALGEDVPSVLLSVVTDPLGALQLATTPGVKVETLLWVFAPVLFVALLSPMVAPAVPLLAERLLAAGMPTWWDIWYQYDAFLVIPVLCAAVDGARRLGGWVQRAVRRLPRASEAVRFRGFGLGYAGAICLIAVLLVPRFLLGDLGRPDFYAPGHREQAQRAAIARVPDGALVAAANHIGPQLTSRCRVLLYDGDPSGAPWVVVDLRRWHFPFPSLQRQRERARELQQRGYEIVFRRQGMVVFHWKGDGKA